MTALAIRIGVSPGDSAESRRGGMSTPKRARCRSSRGTAGLQAETHRCVMRQPGAGNSCREPFSRTMRLPAAHRKGLVPHQGIRLGLRYRHRARRPICLADPPRGPPPARPPSRRCSSPAMHRLPIAVGWLQLEACGHDERCQQPPGNGPPRPWRMRRCRPDPPPGPAPVMKPRDHYGGVGIEVLQGLLILVTASKSDCVAVERKSSAQSFQT
jgi:hypothetical protein